MATNEVSTAPIDADGSPSLSSVRLAFAMSLGALALFLAAGADDGLYLPSAIVGVVAATLAWKARARLAAGAEGRRMSLVALLLGGVLGAWVMAYSVVYFATELF